MGCDERARGRGQAATTKHYIIYSFPPTNLLPMREKCEAEEVKEYKFIRINNGRQILPQ